MNREPGFQKHVAFHPLGMMYPRYKLVPGDELLNVISVRDGMLGNDHFWGRNGGVPKFGTYGIRNMFFCEGRKLGLSERSNSLQFQ